LAITTANAGWQRNFIVLGSCVLVTAGLYWAQRLLIPIVLAMLLTFVLSPLVTFLQRGGLGRVPSALLAVLLASVCLVGITVMLAVQLKNLAAELPTHQEQIIEKIKNLQNATKDSWLEEVQTSMQDLLERVRAETSDGQGGMEWPVTFRVEAPGLMTLLVSTASPIIDLLVFGVLVIILVAFMLIHRESLRNRLIRLWGHGSLTRMTRAIDDGTRRISRFLLMQVIVNVVQGACLGLGLFFIGVPYAGLWGFLAAALRYIPYVGVWLAALPPLLLSVAIMPGWSAPLLVLLLFLAVELVNANVVEPRLYGQSIGVSEVALLISAAFWAWLWGPFGLILSTPLTACLVVLGRHVPHLEFFSILLGDEPVLAPHVTWYQRLIARDEHEAADVIEQALQGHSKEEVYERVLLPGLNLARQNRERGELTWEDEQEVLQAAQEALEEMQTPPVAAPADLDRPESGAAPVLVLGLPAHDQADDLGLTMFKDVLPQAACRFEVVSSRLLLAEIVNAVAERNAALVLIATLSAGGLAHTRYLCKRLRGRFPDMKILVGCWGFPDLAERSRKKLEDAGADHVGTSLAQTRQQLIPLVQFLTNANATGAAEGAERRARSRTVGASKTPLVLSE